MNRALSSALGGLALLVLLFFLSAPAASATGDIGLVIALAPGASVVRDGQTLPLALQAGIRVSDTVKTNASGRVKILFDDDSSLSLGPDTVLDMNEYADAGRKSAFAVHVPHGLVRAITGQIVDKNPAAFKVTTPQTTIGIRGTIVSLRVGGNRTTIYVENTLRQVVANGITVPSGNKISFAPGEEQPAPVPIQPQDRRELGRDLAFLGGDGSAAAAQEPGESGTATEQFAAAGGSLVPQETLMADAGVTQSLATENLQVPPVGRVSGTVDTVFSMASGNPPVVLNPGSSWGFNVNLQSGNISGGYLQFTGTLEINPGFPFPVNANYSNGTGALSANGFQFTAPGTFDAGGSLSPQAYANVFNSSSNPIDLQTAPSGAPVHVGFQLHNYYNLEGYGTGTGTFTKP